MKKTRLTWMVLFSAFIISGCGESFIELSSDVYNFLYTIDFNNTFKSVNTGDIEITYTEYYSDGKEAGKSISKLTFSKTSLNSDFYFHYDVVNSGNQISNNDSVMCSSTELKNIDGTYLLTKKQDENETFEEVDYDEAYSMFSSIFFNNDTPFRYGGLYYGDYFQANSHKYGNNFILNGDILTFKIIGDNTMFEGATCDQKISINSFGMLTNCYEKVLIDSTKVSAVYTLNANYN